ncbi:MAG TPA: glycosyltransferase [Thermoplasmatales archaeon]|nr:glycosyltransferase [Thermoplasmatales archaeon]
MLISIIVPTKNEEKNIEELLKILIPQEQPIEIIIADGGSKDATHEIVKKYMQKNPNIKLYVKKGTIGESMNYAIEKAEGEAISFLGADDRPDKDWIKNIRKALKKGNNIVAGKCIIKGKKYFQLDRVKFYHKGFDISIPGTNTTYRKEVLIKLNGFDPRFITAEDIDLNYRAVNAGYKIYFEENAIVYRYARENVIDFLKQAYRNGYGRKQLTLKHGRLWKQYSLNQMFSTHLTFLGMLRLFFGLLGYLICKITGGGIRK